MLRFDHARITERVAQLPERLRVAFAAAVSERLFPHAEAFLGGAGPDAVSTLRRGLDLLWKAAVGAPVADSLRDDARSASERAIRVAAGAGTDDALFAENAAAKTPTESNPRFGNNARRSAVCASWFRRDAVLFSAGSGQDCPRAAS